MGDTGFNILKAKDSSIQTLPLTWFRSTGCALLAGMSVAGVLAIAIVLGSNWLTHFDAELLFYAVGSILAGFAVGYRFTVWAQRPPSRMYLKRGVELLFQRVRSGRGFGGLKQPIRSVTLVAADKVVAQNFIRRRSVYRWVMHLCLSGGCTLAFAITFPLVFGWVHFGPMPDDAETYRVFVMGLPLDQFSVHGIKGFLMFNLLNGAAIIVLVGLVMAAIRRLTDAGERATQTFMEDILPLVLIGAVTATGLALTVSYKFLGGAGHHLWAVVHLVSVLALLFHIPFGKLFHMFQRLCSVCVGLYKKAGAEGPRALCVACGDGFASAMHIADMKTVLDQLGFDYRFQTPDGEVHYQDVCPGCRRKLVVLNQGKAMRR